MYAEPGSHIKIEAQGEFPWDLKFEGDFQSAQKLLYNFNKEQSWLKQRINHNELTWWWFSEGMYSGLTKAIDHFDDYTEAYKSEIPEYVFDFITNELKANLMCGVLRYLSTIEYRERKTFGNIYTPEDKKLNKNYLERVLGKNDIHELYNPYGMFSRQFANQYFSYYLQNVKKVRDVNFFGYTTMAIPSTIIRYYGDLPHKIEIAKTLLAGHALYGQIAEMLVQENSRVYNQESKDIDYRKREVEKYLGQIIRLCNDPEFTQSLKAVIETQSHWDDIEYVPNVKFFNDIGEARYMQDFMGEKPTLFYITQQWSQERYFFDELAEKNKDINFVLVAEGSNIQEWMDYTKRAEPVAHQLFFINHEKQLSSIFKSDSHHFIAYDKEGKRIGFHGNMVSAMNLCKQSLDPKKKELNKSQLKLIIILLLIFLAALIIVLFLWKWRVRQRFRREAQHRKLRELELTAIRSQMNPHFLFNSLNSVQNLVQQNKGREAHLYLSDFAGLIRKVLNNSEKEEVSLAEELEMVRQYLNLEKLRFDFDYRLDVSGTVDIHNTMVPSMILQPFVENAIMHGLQNKDGARKLKVVVLKVAKGIKISIEDNGIGRKKAEQILKQKNGKGTQLVKDRLEILQEQQGERYSLNIIDLAKGTKVEIVLPEEE